MTEDGLRMNGDGRFTVGPILLVAVMFTLMGCVPTVRQIDTEYTLPESADVGVVIASLTYQGGYSAYSMRFRPLSQESEQRLQIGSSQTLVPPGMRHWDIEYPGTRGQLFAVELPPGRYEIFRWDAASGPARLSPGEDFSIPFDVVPGEVTYIGNFNFKATDRFGATITKLNVMHVDEFERDAEVASRKYPRLEIDQTTLKLPPGYQEEMVGGATDTIVTLIIML